MRHKQNKVVYLITSIGNHDNTVDFADEEPQTFDSEEKALNAITETTEEYGMRGYVYKCIPVLRVDRGKTKVTRLMGVSDE